jgi:hypothetical protein
LYVQRSFSDGVDNHMVQTLETEPSAIRLLDESHGLQSKANAGKTGSESKADQ